MQLVLTLGTLEWIRTLATLAMRRSQQGEPFLRMAMILGSVAAVTLVSALLFETQKLRRIYGTGGSASGSGEHTDATSSNRTEDCSTD